MSKILLAAALLKDTDMSAAESRAAQCCQRDMARTGIHPGCNRHEGQNIVRRTAVTLHENFMKRRA
jgi:hypothetical protein